MKKLKLSLSMAEASDILKSNVRTISPTANRMLSETDFYGDVLAGENETSFTLGIGPTGFVTACGKIIGMGPHMSEISYCFKGPFWLFLTRDSINSRIAKIFQQYLPGCK